MKPMGPTVFHDLNNVVRFIASRLDDKRHPELNPVFASIEGPENLVWYVDL
jgi:hypothetical protein